MGQKKPKKRYRLRNPYPDATALGLMIITALSVLVTCGMALYAVPRVSWMAIVSVLLIFLSGFNRLRIRSAVKNMQQKLREKRKVSAQKGKVHYHVYKEKEPEAPHGAQPETQQRNPQKTQAEKHPAVTTETPEAKNEP